MTPVTLYKMAFRQVYEVFMPALGTWVPFCFFVFIVFFFFFSVDWYVHIVTGSCIYRIYLDHGPPCEPWGLNAGCWPW